MSILRVFIPCLIVLALTTTAVAGPKEDAALLPSGTSFVIQADLAALKATPLFKQLVSSNPVYPTFVSQFQLRTGVNVDTQVKTITIGIVDNNQGDGMFMLMDAPLNLATPALSAPTVKRRRVGKNDYYVIGGREGALANFKGRTLMGPEDLLRQILTSKKRVSKKMKAASDGRASAAQLWIFGEPPKGKMQGTDDFNYIDASLDLSTGLNVDLALTGRAETIKTMVDQFQMQKQAIAANPMMAMGVGGLLSKLSMVGKGTSLNVTLRLTPAELAQLQAMLQSMLQAQAAAAGQGGGLPPGMPGMPGAPGAPGAMPQMPMIPPGRTIKPPSTK